MKLSELICQTINEENAKKGCGTNFKVIKSEPKLIDSKGRVHNLDGKFSK